MKERKTRAKSLRAVEKAPTGISGLDAITFGGLPRGRTTLVTGGPGCGKTLLATQFIVNGIREHGEPGVYVAFEETANELAVNMAPLGVNLHELIAAGRLVVDYIHVDPSEIEHTGAYDLEALFVRIDAAVRSVNARRVALDTVEVLFAGLPDPLTVRAEVRRLFRWLKDRGVTSIATGERAEANLTRHGLEEFVSDCVIMLDHRTEGEISTRHLQVVKYRGSMHGTNRYPFLIGEKGITVTPITSLGLEHKASNERVSTGIPKLDAMLGGKGVFRGSSTLISGSAGTGKTSLAAHFLNAACRRGEKAALFAFEESKSQIVRNMLSIGIDLERWSSRGLLRFYSVRPTSFGLEVHLSQMYAEVEQFRPRVVAVDPISNLISIGTAGEASSMVRRLVDYFKCVEVTAVFTDLTAGAPELTQTELGVSSLMDTWLLIQHIEHNGERNRALSVLKSRGTAHSNQVRELVIGSGGIQLADVYLGPEGVLTGSAKLAGRRRDELERNTRALELRHRREALDRRRTALEAEIAAMRAEFEASELEYRRSALAGEGADRASASRDEIARFRSNQGEAAPPPKSISRGDSRP